MKQIFAGEVYEILPLSNGILFSYNREELDDNVLVAYKMISFDNGRFTDVAKNVYLITKFGNNYKAVVSKCDNYITVKSILLPNGKVFLLSANGSAQLLDTDASVIWTGDLLYRSCVPSDIVLYDNALWASYAECNTLLKYNLATMREELRIGGGANSPFDKPRDIFLEGDNAMISNQGSKKLLQINLTSYKLFEYESFDEAISQYVKVADNRFAILESGLYLI